VAIGAGDKQVETVRNPGDGGDRRSGRDARHGGHPATSFPYTLGSFPPIMDTSKSVAGPASAPCASHEQVCP
jgi:hypothetical protein